MKKFKLVPCAQLRVINKDGIEIVLALEADVNLAELKVLLDEEFPNHGHVTLCQTMGILKEY